MFTIYTSESEDSLVLMVGSEIAIIYQDADGTFNEDALISFDASTNDLEWHRIGLSIKGDSITMIFDCDQQQTRKLPRTLNSHIATDGLIMLGMQLDEEDEYFMGDLQLLMIADKPDAAYEICTKYAPNCASDQTYFTQSFEANASRISEGDSSSSRSASTINIQDSSAQNSRQSSGNENLQRSQKLILNSFGNGERSTVDGILAEHGVGLESVSRSSPANFEVRNEAAIGENSAESDGLGFNSEDEYYDDLNSDRAGKIARNASTSGSQRHKKINYIPGERSPYESGINYDLLQNENQPNATRSVINKNF